MHNCKHMLWLRVRVYVRVCVCVRMCVLCVCKEGFNELASFTPTITILYTFSFKQNIGTILLWLPNEQKGHNILNRHSYIRGLRIHVRCIKVQESYMYHMLPKLTYKLCIYKISYNIYNNIFICHHLNLLQMLKKWKITLFTLYIGS